jgi:hypothetical protein
MRLVLRAHARMAHVAGAPVVEAVELLPGRSSSR